MSSILAFKNFIIGPEYLGYKLSVFFIGGSLISTTFMRGVKVGLMSFIPLLINNFILTKLFGRSNSKDNTKSLDALLNKPFGVAVCAPIIEEVLFRGVLLNMMIIFTTSLLRFYSDYYIKMVSVLLSSLIFGLAHLFNNEEMSRDQAMNATLGGIIKGILMLKFGLLASIGMHTANNSIITVFYSIGCLLPKIQHYLEEYLKTLDLTDEHLPDVDSERHPKNLISSK